MQKQFYIPVIFFIVCGFLFYTACLKPPSYSEVPNITFKGISKSVVKEGADSVTLVFSFTDGDGDLGPAYKDDPTQNVFLTDSRDASVKNYQMPDIAPSGNIKAISGDITILIKPFSCRAGKEDDKLTYKIQIKDRAGHLSNIVESAEINIDCDPN